MDLQALFNSNSHEIDAISNDIASLNEKIDKLSKDIENSHNSQEKAQLRHRESQLLDKESQLRNKEAQLRNEKAQLITLIIEQRNKEVAIQTSTDNMLNNQSTGNKSVKSSTYHISSLALII